MSWMTIWQSVTAARIRVALYLLAAVALFVGGYYLSWRLRPVNPSPNQIPVATQGGGTVYQGPQVPAIEKKKPKPQTVVRPVVTIPTIELPPEEQAKIPAIPPAAGGDNVVRPTEFATSTVVPPQRGNTFARAYVLPSGEIQITQDPQREKFVGWPWKDGNWKRLEFEGGMGTGGKKWDGGAAWFPLRIGAVQIGAKAEVWGEDAGGTAWSSSFRVRFEPFRNSYR